MKNAAPGEGRRGIAITASSSISLIEDIRQPQSRAQALRTDNASASDIHVGAIWKSPRDKSRAIDARLRHFNGHDFAEFRLLQMDSAGRMVPTGKGVSVSVKQLGRFSQLVGSAYRKAEAMGLTPRSS